jgi:Tfp pilus assembly protein PilV
VEKKVTNRENNMDRMGIIYRKSFLKEHGSTLIELLIATMIVGTIVTAVAAGVASSVKNNSESRYRELAVSLGQQAIEVLRKERAALGWSNFFSALSDNVYCVRAGVTQISNFTTNINNCSIIEANTDFKRTVEIKKSGTDTVYAKVEVSWERQANEESKISLTQEFKDISTY